MKATVKRVGNKISVSCTPYRQKAKSRGPKNPNNERTSQSISAAKRAIHEIVLCNDWEYMVTLEFSPKVVKQMGGSDTIIKMILQWFRNIKKRDRRYKDLKWLLVPEPYTDRRKKLHLHGFLSGVPYSELIEWSNVKGRKPAAVRAKIKEGRKVYTWPVYRQKFGFCLLACAGSAEDVYRWGQYVKKSLVDARHYRASGQHLYYGSRGLSKAEVLAQGDISACGAQYIKAIAEKSYAHRMAPGEHIYGRTYILDADVVQTQKIEKIISKQE